MDQLIININKKYKILILTSSIFSLFSWIYVSCINNVYPNTKYNSIKSSIFLFIVMEIVYFIKFFLQSVFRYFSLKYKLKKSLN